MKREVTRKKRFPACQIDSVEFGIIWKRLLSLFVDSKDSFSILTLELPEETLKFDSFEEFQTYPSLPDRVTKFSLLVAKFSGPSVSFSNSNSFSNLLEIRASGENEAWCAGVVETVDAFVRQHKVWYSPIVTAPVGEIFSFLIAVTWGIAIFLPKDYKIPSAYAYGWIAIALTCALLYLGRGRLFPVFSIVIRERAGFVRNHIGELSLAVALISAVFTGIGLFLGK